LEILNKLNLNFKLETIAFNIESCHIAQIAGAQRIELCDNPGEGGTTPSYGFIKAARKALSIDLFPIIRPRGGDFLYSDEEFEIMKADVQLCKELGCDGIVVGMLNEDATIDKKRSSILVNIAYPMSVTFHRAFDRVTAPDQALEDVIEIGCERILTSGFHPAATDGAENIKKLIELAGERIIIMPGSGVRSENIISLAESTGAVEFHSSARKNTGSQMKVVNPYMNEELKTVRANAEEIKAMIEKLSNIQR
jgi:copper homeostasis protein